jgi:DNA-binding MarR family transcriptional regulator
VDPVLDPEHPRTTYLIGRLDRVVRRALEERLRPYGVTLLGYTAMTVLAVRPGLSNAQLARRSFMTPQGMNQAIAVLVDGGLVRSTPDENNRRRRRIELTAAGWQVVGACTAAVEQYEQQLLSILGDDARDQLNFLLRTVVEADRQRQRGSSTARTSPEPAMSDTGDRP